MAAASPHDDYLAAVPPDQRAALQRLRDLTRARFPQAEEVISYQMPGFRLPQGIIGGYAAFKRHCSWFPHSGTVLPQLAEELAGFTWKPGTLQFTAATPIPEALFQRILTGRLAELER